MKIFLLLLFASNLLAQDDSIVKYFTGKWKLISDTEDYFEEWEFVNKTDLAGVAYNYEEGESVIVENLYLKKFGNQWTYIALPANQSITLFALTDFRTINLFLKIRSTISRKELFTSLLLMIV